MSKQLVSNEPEEIAHNIINCWLNDTWPPHGAAPIGLNLPSLEGRIVDAIWDAEARGEDEIIDLLGGFNSVSSILGQRELDERESLSNEVSINQEDK